MTAPTIEALRRAYEAGRSSTFRDGQTDCRPANDGHHDAGLKAVAEMALEGVKWDLHNGQKARHAFEVTAKRLDGVEAERDAARAEAQQARREKNQTLHELAATRRDAEKAHEALKAEAAELDRRLADAEDRRYELKEALCREEERRYAAMRRARVWKAAAKRWRAEVERLRAALKWYADESRYDFSKYFSHSEAEADNGDRAREALRGGPGQGGGA